MMPDNACPVCRELGKCALREYKGYTTCERSGSCSYGEEAFRQPTLDERFGPGSVFTQREFDASEKP